MIRPRGRTGFTLVELLVAITIAGLLMSAIYRVLQGNQRFYQAQQQILDIQQNIRAIAQILPGELRELDPGDGDILAMSADSIRIKAMRSFSVICAPPNVGAGQIVVRNALTYGYRAMDPTRDSVLVFRDGDPEASGDDRWLRAPIAGMAAANCTDGSAGTRLTLTGMVGGTAQLGPSGATGDQGVLTGAPVRTFELVTYRLYNEGTGIYWLGMRNYSGGAWGATSPIAGPLRPTDGVQFEYRDANSNITWAPANVRRIRLTIRGRSIAPINIPGRPRGHYEDSLVTRIAVRNYARY